MFTTGVSTLRGKKAAYGKRCGTLDPFAWLGKCSRIGGVEVPKGDTNISYEYATRRPGAYERDQEWISAPGPTTTSIIMKETIHNAMYDGLADCKFDLDTRTLLCGEMDDPTNWSMIKRLCCARISNVSTDGETSFSPDDEGETLITGSISVNADPDILYQVAGQRIHDYDLMATTLINISACNGPACPGACGPGKDCKLVAVALRDEADPGHPLYAESTDGGRTWVMIEIDELAYSTNDLDSIACYGDLIVAVAANEPGYAVSWDAGETRVVINDTTYPEFNSNPPLTVAIESFNSILIGGINGYIWTSEDGGMTLTVRDGGAVTTSDISRVRWFGKYIAYAVGANNTMKRSFNGGKSWEAVTLAASMAGETVTDVLRVSSSILLVTYEEGSVWYSEDSGLTWAEDIHMFPAEANEIHTYAFAMCSCGNIFLAGSVDEVGKVFRNVDHGAPDRWIDLPIDDNPGILYWDIACCSPNHVVAVGNFSGVHNLPVITVFEA